MWRKLFLAIGIALMVGVIVLEFRTIGPALPPAPTPDLYAMVKANTLPCIVFYDASRPGAFPNSFYTTLAGAEVQVDDPQGPDTGHYPADKCFLHGTTAVRIVTLTLTLPQGYTTTQHRQFTYSVPPSSTLSAMIDIEQQVWNVGVQTSP